MTVPGVKLTQNKTKTNQDSDFQEIEHFLALKAQEPTIQVWGHRGV